MFLNASNALPKEGWNKVWGAQVTKSRGKQGMGTRKKEEGSLNMIGREVHVKRRGKCFSFLFENSSKKETERIGQISEDRNLEGKSASLHGTFVMISCDKFSRL